MKRCPDAIPAVRRLLAAVAAVALAALPGCTGYRLGSTLPPGIKTVHVPTFVNTSGEPGVDIAATRATLQEIQKDGTLRLADAASADAVLRVTVTGHALEPVRFSRNDTRTTSEYRLWLKADMELQAAGTGQVLVKRRVTGYSTFLPAGDLTTAKTQALPATAADMAHNIVESIVEFW